MIQKWIIITFSNNHKNIFQKKSNSNCNNYFTCSKNKLYILNKTKINKNIKFKNNKSSIIAKKIKIGINEDSLLYTTMLVYFFPLLSFFIIGGIMEFIFLNDVITFLSSFIGINIGFFIVKKIINYHIKKILSNIKIIAIGESFYK